MQNTNPLAPRWRRFVCLFYDALLLTAVLICAIVPMGIVMWVVAKVTGVMPAGRFWQCFELLYFVGTTYGYFALCWRRAGQTLAMKTWRLRLVFANQSANWRIMFTRYAVVAITTAPLIPTLVAAKHIPGVYIWLALLWALLPFLWAYVDRQGQFLHDRLAGSFIVLLPIVREQ